MVNLTEKCLIRRQEEISVLYGFVKKTHYIGDPSEGAQKAHKYRCAAREQGNLLIRVRGPLLFVLDK